MTLILIPAPRPWFPAARGGFRLASFRATNLLHHPNPLTRRSHHASPEPSHGFSPPQRVIPAQSKVAARRAPINPLGPPRAAASGWAWLILDASDGAGEFTGIQA